MNVLMRQEPCDSDLAWAAADASMAAGMEQLLLARASLASESLRTQGPSRDDRVVEPAVLRAWGAL